ncbi:MAG: sensor histidine kinase [Candidatus Nitronauta litoralis]|uniref:Sensor histidine kinase n=1 Tax=Candidatus Nitronauta litoralis TaxID=2705533 RepID=A0A7T0BZ31_9BACT|nr:MAG: sensor histidine kinase [Candidatus Nitronauta litoralis]
MTHSKRKPTQSQFSFIQNIAKIASLAIEDQKRKIEIRKLKAKASNEVEDRTQKIREAIRQLQDEIVQRKIMERSLKTSNEKLQNLSNHLENVREEERTRISREIHDELGQMLTTLKMKLAILEERTLEEGFPIQEDIQVMMGLVETTLETVRRISTELRPGILDVLGLSEALEWQAQEFQEQTQIKIHSEIQRLPENLGKELSTTCFRICQEALTNVARHANAKHVTVSLKHEQGKLELIVRDNGKGITNEQLSRITSLGLIGMRERAQNLGGDLNIERAAPNGTEVSFSFPLELA